MFSVANFGSTVLGSAMFSTLTLALLFVVTQGDKDLAVSTTSGIVSGKRDTVLNKRLKIFLGVPYARPPVGDLRFRYPVPFEAEGVVRDAKSFAPICYQPPHATEVMSPLLKPNTAAISEDCLYLNIFVPDTEIHEPIPVLFWISGEGFNYADPVQFDGGYLSGQGNVILVTLSYRLSVFGFLSGLHDDAPGNVGLFDQRMALKWVKNNIIKFGGDPSRITLSGRFTGAMSAAIHAFSPLSKEEVLFQHVILHSGVPAGDWVFDRNPLNATFTLAQTTDCGFPTMAESIGCFRKLPAEVLFKAASEISWRPTFDFNLIYEHTFKAAAKLNYNPVDILIAQNSNEGSLCLTALKAMKSDLFEKIVQGSLTNDDSNILFKYGLDDIFKEDNDFVSKLTAYHYRDSEIAHLRDRFVDFCGDIYINAHSQKLADIIAATNQTVYFYELNHRPSFSNQPDFIKAGHGDDVLYALGLPLQLKDLPEEEVTLTRKMMKTVSNFAYNGNPNSVNVSTWPSYTTENRLFMKFFLGHETVQKSSHIDAAVFWHDIIPTARKMSCPQLPVASSLVDEKKKTSEEGLFVGPYVTVPTAEYVIMALMCVSGFLLMTTAIVIVVVLKMKHTAFQRLK